MDNACYQSTEVENCQIPDKKGNASEYETRHRTTNPALSGPEAPEKGEIVALRKSIGLLSCVGLLVGTIIGSGIFISPKGVLIGSGSIGLTLVIWFMCGIFSFLGALAFAELGTLIPLSGGQYTYFLAAFAPTRKTEKLYWGPLIAFLYNWQITIFSRPAGVAVQGLSIATYLMKLAYVGCVYENSENDHIKIKVMAATIIVLITYVNYFSVKASTSLINFFTAAKLLALVFIMVGGAVSFARGENNALSTGFEDTTFSFSGIALAFYSGLWAYAGWDNLNNIAREVQNPGKNILRAMMASCTLVTTVYLLTNISYFILLTKSEFSTSDAVAVDFGSKLVGKAGGFFIILSVACSIFGSTVGGTLVGVRISYAAAREGHMVDFFSYLNINYMTPSVSLVFSLLLSLFMVINSNILSLIFLTGFMDAIFIGISMIALLRLRKVMHKEERKIKVPLIVPGVMFVFSALLVVTPFIDNPRIEYFYILAFLAVGVLTYTVFVYYAVRVRGMDKVRKVIQILFQAAPPEDEQI